MGGFASLKTQYTVLDTSLVSKKILPLVFRFGRDFNLYLERRRIGPVTLVGPVGSAGWADMDLSEGKNELYGDVDYLFEFPFIEGKFSSLRERQTKTINFYKELMQEFVPLADYLDGDSKGKCLIFKVGDGYAQVDIMGSTPDTSHWAKGRYMPQRGLKGMVTGSVFSMMNKLFNISIGDRGVVVRTRDGKVVPGRMRKNVRHVVISTNYETFWLDLLWWLNVRKGQPKHFAWTRKGMDPNNPRMRWLVRGLSEFIGWLDVSNLLGGDVFPQKTPQDLAKDMKEEYSNIVYRYVNGPKFDKSKARLALDAKKKYMEDAETGISILEEIL